MAVTLCSSGAALLKAGSGANILFRSDDADAKWTELINQAEAYLCVLSRVDWVTKYSDLDSRIKLILEEATSNIAAMYAIAYDSYNYSDRIEAENLMKVLWARTEQIITLLEEQKNTGFVEEST